MIHYRRVPVWALALTLLAAALVSRPVQGEEPEKQEKARFHVYLRSADTPRVRGYLMRQSSFDNLNQAVQVFNELQEKNKGKEILIGFSVKATPDEGVSQMDVYIVAGRCSYAKKRTTKDSQEIAKAARNVEPAMGEYMVFVSPEGR
jgi:hypothetical protein